MDQMGQSPEGIGTIELRDYWRPIRQRWWIVLLCVVLVVAAAVAVGLRATPRYRASATVVREGTSLGEALFGAQVYEYSDPQRELETAAGSVTVAAVAEKAKAALGSARSAADLAGMVSAVPSKNSNTLSVSATGEQPDEVAAVANAFADGFVAVQFDKKKADVALARKVVEGQLKAMTASELKSPRGVSLADRAETLGIIEQLQTGDYAVSRPASVPGAPFEPKPWRNAMLALAVGLMVGVGLVFLLEYADRRLKTDAAVEREFGLPVLGLIPAVGKGWGRSGDRASAPVGFREDSAPLIESYRSLRSNLQFFEVDRRLRTILVTSALPQEGKTTTTINLALSLALAGARVIILETDLRRPMIHTYLGLDNEIGLTNVLAGTFAFSEALQLVHMDEFAPPDARRISRPANDGTLLQKNLYVMTSGPLPPNPAELVGSVRMRELLEKVSEAADYVLVDSPPVLSVADAMSVAGLVDGVLLTARMFHTTMDEARQVRALLARAGQEVKAIGVVVGGVKADRQYSYRYGYYGGTGQTQGRPAKMAKGSGSPPSGGGDGASVPVAVPKGTRVGA